MYNKRLSPTWQSRSKCTASRGLSFEYKNKDAETKQKALRWSTEPSGKAVQKGLVVHYDVLGLQISQRVFRHSDSYIRLSLWERSPEVFWSLFLFQPSPSSRATDHSDVWGLCNAFWGISSSLSTPFSTGVFCFGTRGSALSRHTWTEHSLFSFFFIFNSLFFLHQESAMIILLSAETDRRSLLLLSIRPWHPVCPRLQFFAFLPPWKKKINSLLSRLLLSQRQAGLGVPSRSDRSLITATVSQGGDGGGGWGSAGVRGEEGRREERRWGQVQGKRRLEHAWGGEGVAQEVRSVRSGENRRTEKRASRARANVTLA